MKPSPVMRKLVAGAILAGLLPMTNAFALSAFPTTGTCAMLVTIPVPLGVTIPADNQAYNVLAVIDLSAKTIKFAQSSVKYTTTGIVLATGRTSAVGGEGTFVVETLSTPAPSEARRLSFSITSPSASTFKANAIAVNGANTILMQGDDQPFSGVCNF